MCLIVFARNSHPDYPLVVVANRDEYHDREATIAHWWPHTSQMVAGKDNKAGGTWMGATLSGRWGAVTNYRDGNYEPAPRSRGELVTDYLSGTVVTPAESYLEGVAERADQYSGFSLLLGDGGDLYYFSNRGRGPEAVSDGIHSLSNHLLDAPWPKSELGRLKLNRLLHKSHLELEELFAVLANQEPFADHELPTTGVGIEMERVLSPPFICGDTYGTRCTTVFMVNRAGEAVFAEQSFLPEGEKGPLSLFEFSWPRT